MFCSLFLTLPLYKSLKLRDYKTSICLCFVLQMSLFVELNGITFNSTMFKIYLFSLFLIFARSLKVHYFHNGLLIFEQDKKSIILYILLNVFTFLLYYLMNRENTLNELMRNFLLNNLLYLDLYFLLFQRYYRIINFINFVNVMSKEG